MAEDTKTHWGRNASKNPFKPKAKAAPPPPIFLPQVATPERESFNTMDFGPSNRATSMSAIRDAFNNSNPANYSTVDPSTTAPNVATPPVTRPRLPEPVYGSADQSLDPAVNLASLQPQFDNIVLDPIIPTPPSSVDPQALLAQALQRRAQQAAMDVELRKQQQLEQGVGTYIPKSSVNVSDYLNKTVPQDRLTSVGDINAGNVFTTKAVPGIGHVTDILPTPNGPGGRVMTGRYGTGTATTTDRPHPNRSITENGKQVPIADWFKDAARSQNQDNKFARPVATGKVAADGTPVMQGVAIPAGSDAGTERILAGLKSGAYNPRKGGWQS